MIGDFIAGGLAVNKIVDQGAEIRRGQQDYNKLVRRYNLLVDVINERDTQIGNLKNQIREIEDSSAKRIDELLWATSHKNTEIATLEKEVKYLSEWKETALEEFDKQKQERDLRWALDKTAARVLDEIPEEERMKAMAKILAEHPPEDMNREFVIDCGDQVEEKLVKDLIFPNGMSNPDKFVDYKERALKKDHIDDDTLDKKMG